MAERVVVSRSRKAEAVDTREFAFPSDFVRGLAGAELSPAIRDYRLSAWETFQATPMPTTSDEAWRRTDIRGMRAGAFRLPEQLDLRTLHLPEPPEDCLKPLAGEAHGGQLVLTADGARLDLDPELARQGVVFTDLRTAERQHPELLAELLGQVVRPDEGKFAALAAALAQTGVLVYVPRGVQVEKPLHSVLWAPGVDLAYIDHILVWVDQGASLTYVHESASHTEATGQAMHAGLVEICCR